MRQQLLDAIYAGQPFRVVLRDLGLTSNQVWGLAKTDQEWSEKLDRALTSTRRDDLEHGTNAAYVHGCLQLMPGVSACPDGYDALTTNSAQCGFSAHVLAYAYRSNFISPSRADTTVKLGGSQC
jgi:hypothetical protein